MRKLRRKYRTQQTLRSDEHGLTTLEFALISPVMAIIMLGIIEFSMIMYATAIMESATNSTSRLGKTGYDPSGITRNQAIIDSITTKTAGLLDTSKLEFSSKAYTDFTKISKPEPCLNPTSPPCDGTPGIHYIDVNGNGMWDSDMGAAGLGNEGEVVVYSVTYPWKIMTPLVASILGEETLDITVRTVVRNEPFGTPTGG